MNFPPKATQDYPKALRSAVLFSALLAALAHFVFGGYLLASLVWLLNAALVCIGGFLFAAAWVVLWAWKVFWWAIEHSWLITLDTHVTKIGITQEFWFSYPVRLAFFTLWVFFLRFFAVTNNDRPWAMIFVTSLGLATFIPIADDAGGWWRLTYIPIILLTCVVTGLLKSAIEQELNPRKSSSSAESLPQNELS